MSFDISKIDTQDVVNANKMLRSAHFRCLLTTFVRYVTFLSFVI